MKTIAVWFLVSFLPNSHCYDMRFPTQQACEQFAHQLDFKYQQATKQRTEPSSCVKTNIVVKS